jgi:acyl carrier protein
MGATEVTEKVNEFLIEEFELEETQLVPSALMKDDLDIESLDFVDIAVIIEQKFGLKVSSADIQKIITLEDLYNYILNHSNN